MWHRIGGWVVVRLVCNVMDDHVVMNESGRVCCSLLQGGTGKMNSVRGSIYMAAH